MKVGEYILAYENETLVIVSHAPDRKKKEVTSEEADAIESLFEIEDLDINESKWARRTRGEKLKLGQYVGLITVGNLSVEILAKVEHESEGGPKTDLNQLIALFLRDSNRTIFSAKSYDQRGVEDSDIFRHLVANFFDKVKHVLNFGLRCEYQAKEETAGNIKGRINFSQFAAMAGRSPGQFPCAFDEFTQDSLHNQIIKQAVTILSRQRAVIRHDRHLQTSAAGILDQLEHVSDTHYSYEDIREEVADSLESRQATVLEFAKRVIAGNTPFIRSKTGGRKLGFTMVWEMSAIYEKAIGMKVQEYVKSRLPAGCSVVLQGKLAKQDRSSAPGHTSWNSHLAHTTTQPTVEPGTAPPRGMFRLKPDIMILSPRNEVLAVLDTKWKNYSGVDIIKARRRRRRTSHEPEETTYKNVAKEDAYQMLSYACAKKSGKDSPEPLVGLLFPSLSQLPPEELFFTNMDSRIQLCWVPVTTDGLNGFDLEHILGRSAMSEVHSRIEKDSGFVSGPVND